MSEEKFNHIVPIIWLIMWTEYYMNMSIILSQRVTQLTYNFSRSSYRHWEFPGHGHRPADILPQQPDDTELFSLGRTSQNPNFPDRLSDKPPPQLPALFLDHQVPDQWNFHQLLHQYYHPILRLELPAGWNPQAGSPDADHDQVKWTISLRNSTCFSEKQYVSFRRQWSILASLLMLDRDRLQDLILVRDRSHVCNKRELDV